MELDLEVCRSIAVRNGLPLQFVFKEFHIINIIGEIAGAAFSSKNLLVLKGGTALNKVYLKKLQRFSEDIDFDLVIKNADQKLMESAKEIASQIKGYGIEEFRRVKDTVQFYCIYKTPLNKDHVRIDISPKKLATAKPLQNSSVYSEFTHSSASGIIVYSIEDLTARKMNALANRAEGKDIYDVSAAMPLCAPNMLKQAIKNMLESEEIKIDVYTFITKMLKKLDNTDSAKIRNITNPFIPSAYRPKNWEELKRDLMLKLEEFQKRTNP